MVDIATPQVEPTNNDRLQRVGINDLKREIALTRSPLVVTSGGKPLGIIYPYDPKLDKQVQTQVTKYKAGDVTYAKYKEEMLAAAMEALMERQVLVKPSDIIASENLEEVKKKNKIDGQRLLLEGAKFWAGRHDTQLCIKCGHQMIPEALAEEDPTILEGEISNGYQLPTN